MTEKNKSNKDDAYSQAVASGKYVRDTGLDGKYDNVRVYWEDEVTRYYMRPALEALVDQRLAEKKGIHILDLGCGSGDGYEMLMMMNRSKMTASGNVSYLIPKEHLERYKGIEINRDLLAQNEERWGKDSAMEFSWGDFSQGLPLAEGEAPFDLYLTSYGAMSHLDEKETIKLFSDIARHARDGSILTGDWLGRYTYEWQQLWDEHTDTEQWMDYYISYIYPEEIREEARKSLTPLKLRLLCRQEVERLIQGVKEQTGIDIEIKYLGDRSIFVGRHMDTNDYNPHLRPLRKAVNSLLERNVRTVLEDLFIEYVPHPEIVFPGDFFNRYCASWNALVKNTLLLCQNQDKNGNSDMTEAFDRNAPGREFEHMKKVVKDSSFFCMEDARANFIEPQLALCLRSLEMSMQKGDGYGHGLFGVFKIKKTA